MTRRVRVGTGRRRSGRKQAESKEWLQRQVLGVVLVAACVWLYLGLAGSGGGRIGRLIGEGLGIAVGGGRLVVPALIGALGVQLAMGRPLVLTGRVWGVLVLGGTGLAALHTPVAEAEMFAAAVAGQGGGILGGALAWGLTKVFGLVGRYVILAAAAVAGLLLLTQWPLDRVLGRLLDGISMVLLLLRDGMAALWRWSRRDRTRPARPQKGLVRPPATARSAPQLDGAEPAATETEPPWDDDKGPVIHIANAARRQSAAPAAAAGPDGAAPEHAAEKPASAETADNPAPIEAADKPAPAQPLRSSAAAGVHARGAGPEDYPGYRRPPLDLMAAGQGVDEGGMHRDIMERARLLEHTLDTFGVRAKVIEVHQGPAITRFELQPAPGVKVSKITGLADDLALNLAATDVRIEAPIPGKAAIGIEVPNKEVLPVCLRDVLETPEFQQHPSRLAIGLGKDLAGRPVVGSLERMPHLLIAGATGAGKSTCLNTILCSLLFKARPDEVKMLLIDPKMVEMTAYHDIPHLAAEVVTDPRRAAGFLKWAVREMEQRYQLFARTGVRDITRYNEWVAEQRPEDQDGRAVQPLPYIVIVIDELADLMMVASVEVEDAICRLAQMARAAGMHLVVATQRPSVDVITGLIKANIPSRIAFAVSSQVDSRTILDMAGAEKLLGKGDMLYHPVGFSKPMRAQGAFVAEKEVEALVRYVKQQGSPEFQAEALELEHRTRNNGAGAGAEDEMDPLLGEALRVVIEHGQASVSILQRRLRVNYTRAARLIDDMEQRGWVGEHQGPRPREVLVSLEHHRHLFGEDA